MNGNETDETHTLKTDEQETNTNIEIIVQGPTKTTAPKGLGGLQLNVKDLWKQTLKIARAEASE